VNSNRHAFATRNRRGLSLIELILCLAILGLLAAILLPATQSARQASRRSTCKNNLKQLGLSLHNYESAYKRFPSGGKGTAWDVETVSPLVNPVMPATGETAFAPHSMFTAILPYFDNSPFDPGIPRVLQYNSSEVSDAAELIRQHVRIKVAGFLCPSNADPAGDPGGYGQADYAPTAYTDLLLQPPGQGAVNTTQETVRVRYPGALELLGAPLREITDGISNVIAIAESSGRQQQHRMGEVRSRYLAPVNTQDNCLGPAGTARAYRCPNRWADPSNGMGISGPADGSVRVINANLTPLGGPPACRWTTENCGPNDEIFSFHTGGAHCVFADGAVRFLSESMDAATLGKLVARSDGAKDVLIDF
jgi:prepilin-type N-terminal cleavage/methylation domain-containing protein/prepilin-type processing-associated H-X9-DG protein